MSSATFSTITHQRAQIFNDHHQLDTLQHELIDYTASHGITMLHKQHITDRLYTHAPTTLLPTPISRTGFTKLTALSNIWNKLIDGIARHPTFITEALKNTIEVDDFTAHLYRIYQAARQSTGAKQNYMLGIHRSDYMFHVDSEQQLTAQQVEINTIASSFGALSAKVTKLHTYLCHRLYPQYRDEWFMPKNDAVLNIAQALSAAAQTYCKQQNTDLNSTVILVVTQHNETNVTDQRDIEYAAFQHSGIRCIRRTFDDIHKRAVLDKHSNTLTIDDQHVSVVYYRAGYTPRDYTADSDWDALLRIEQSIAIKCPSTAYHLAGTKKIQQLCTNPEVLHLFISEADAKVVQSVQAGMWGFDDGVEPLRDVLSDVHQNPHEYVLKPQREGGGNNIWDKELISLLDSAKPAELTQYILMRRINAVPQRAALIRNAQVTVTDVISELGIYSTYLSNGADVVVDQFAGHLLRTKTVESNEGGVAAGFAVIDSPVFVL